MMPEVADMAAGTQSAGASDVRAGERTATEPAAQASAETTAEMSASTEMADATAAEMAAAHSAAHMAATTAAARQHGCRKRRTAESDRGDRSEDNISYHRSLLSRFSVQPDWSGGARSPVAKPVIALVTRNL
jgi:hypothetical protein